MKKLWTIASITSAVILGLTWAPGIRADAWDHLTKISFSQPVEIPGQVLPAGTYWFKLLDSPSDRNIVQIYNANQSRELAMLLAIPDYRLKPADKTVITFEERASNAPEAVKAWFYPGDNYGQEFVYPKPRAIQIARNSNQPVPSMPANLEANTKMTAKSASEAPVVAMKQAPVMAQKPNGDEVEIGQIVTTPPQLSATNTPPASLPAPQLPQTASELPSIALAGLGLLIGGAVLLIAAKRRLPEARSRLSSPR